MSKHNEQLIQVGERVVTFSNKPVKVDGVTYRPGWNWSEDYRKTFRRTMAGVTPDKWSGQAADRAYVKWLKESRGMHITELREHIRATQGIDIRGFF